MPISGARKRKTRGDHQFSGRLQSFQQLGLTVESDEITTWLASDVNDPGIQMLTDSEICDLVSKSSDGSELQPDSDEEQGDLDEPPRCPVSHSEAAHMFEQCLRWLECQPEASVYNTSVLRQLHTLSASKRMNSMKQSKLSAYFTHKD